MMGRNISSMLQMSSTRYLNYCLNDIPEYTLALVAYTVSSYSPASGARKDQVTANLHIQFGIVLQEPIVGSIDNEVSGDGEDKAWKK